MDLRGKRGPPVVGLQDLKCFGLGTPATGIPASNIISAVQQQDYSASVWLRRRDKLEHSQQKCIVIFALLCCFAVLVALIFSAVDIWGEDEDGITEDNCSRDCRVVLVENIPEDVTFPNDTVSHLPLSAGFFNLLDQAVRVVEIVSPLWLLNSSEYESSFQPAARQGRLLLSRLLALKARKVQLKISSGITESTELKILTKAGAEVHFVNTTVLTKGHLHSSFWVVDKRHFYLGSGSMEWRSLATRKELGVLVYNCSCLALDLHRVFNIYWGLQSKEFIPSFWSKRLYALFNKDSPLKLNFNSTEAQAYVSTSPNVFIPKDRSSDLDAISQVIKDARYFIYISITDYLPLLNTSTYRLAICYFASVLTICLFKSWLLHVFCMPMPRYWSRIDGFIREALILRRVRVRLLISCWENTHPLTFNFVWSLRSLCMEQANCSLEAKFFNPRIQRDGSLQGINHNRFMVTDRAVYLGNLDWVGNEFTYNAGVGLVINQPKGMEEKNSTVVEQFRAAFERDWFSSYTRSLQANKIPVCNKRQMNRMVTVKGSQVDNGPAPLRNEPNDDGQHGTAKSETDIPESGEDTFQPKIHLFEQKQAQIKKIVWKDTIEANSLSSESSGSREILHGPL
ncbi:inactive phospholipase D5-like isoform X1 [Entelurus aequoreus]|uniref:inactive phospholipase D5-like isoform X1 n=1 Tax=Entelurus aequoreus TaxID=161455 RepID=UPI002B1E1565|nr:inactive phospholipase D5-like isoform X1 [Entelurus aequoreus]